MTIFQNNQIVQCYYMTKVLLPKELIVITARTNKGTPFFSICCAKSDCGQFSLVKIENRPVNCYSFNTTLSFLHFFVFGIILNNLQKSLESASLTPSHPFGNNQKMHQKESPYVITFNDTSNISSNITFDLFL